MCKKLLTILFLVFAFALTAAQPAAAASCQRCNFEFVCHIDECSFVEYCDGSNNLLHYETCYVDFFGTCHDEGDFCRWA
jgi:hypothetical protein